MKQNQTMKTHWIRIPFLLVISLLFTNDIFSQVVGNPGSSQSAVEVCVPAAYDITYRFEFISPANPTDDNRVLFRLIDIDDGSLISYRNYLNVPVQTGPGPLFRKYIEQTHRFDLPVDGDCEYKVEIFFYYEGTFVSSGTQIQYVGNWHTDDEANGTIQITPDIQEVCEGDSLIDFTFQDASDFACVDTSLQNPNSIERNVQFVYNTNPTIGQGIPNLSIDVYGTTVILTDANGDPVPNSWTVDPTDGSMVPAYSTPSGFYEGHIISTGFAPQGGSQLTYPISFPGDDTFVGDYFEVTVRNWNFCNMWNGSQSNPNDADAKTSTARIVIIDSPDPPTAPDKTICEGGDRTLTITSAPVGEFQWYSNPDRTGLLATGASYTQPQTAPGTYEYYVTDKAIAGNNCESQPTKVTLVINPIPNQPDINNTGPLNFCFDGGSTSVTLTADPNDPPSITSYQWYQDGNPFSTSNPIVLNQVSHSGDYTVRTYGVAPTYCASSLSNPITVNVYALATTTTPVDDETCDDDNMTTGNASFSVTTGGAAHTITWQRYNGIGYNDILGPTNPNDGCTYSGYATEDLSISSADIGMDTYRYRVKLLTTAGGCYTYSGSAGLTVHPVADVPTPSDETVCELDPAQFVSNATISSGSITAYQWQRRNGGWTNINAGTDGGVYSGYNTNTLDISSAAESMDSYRYRLVTTSDQGCQKRSNTGRLYVDPLADITTQPSDAEICSGENTSFTVTDDGNPTVTNYQWQRSTGGPFTDIGAGTDGGIYSNWDQATLTVTGATTARDGYQYQCVLTTGGPCTITSNAATLTVNPLPADLSGNVTVVEPRICYSDNTDITISGTEANVDYYLRTGGADVVGPESGPGLVTLNTGALTSNTTYEIHALYTDGTGCDLIFGSFLVTVNNELAVTASVADADATICIGDATTFSVGFTETGFGSGYTYDWSGDNGDNFSGNNVLFTPGAPGSPVTYTVTVADGFGPTVGQCEAIAQTPLTVNVLPGTPIITPNPGTTICYGSGTITLTAAASDALTYQWYEGGVPMTDSTDADIVLSEVAHSGSYTVRAYGINPTSCEGPLSAPTVVTINPLPTPSVSGANSVCFNATETYTTANVGGHSYLWTVNFGTAVTPLTNNSVDVQWDNGTGPGWVRVQETIDATGCVVETPQYSVTVLPGAPAGAPTGPTGVAEVCKNGSIALDCGDVADATQYVWDVSWLGVGDDDDFITGTSDINIDLTGVAAGNRSVKVKARNACGDGPWTGLKTFDINDLPDLSAASDNVCSDDNNSITLGIDNGGAYGITSVSYTINSITDNGMTDSDGTDREGLTGQPANVLQNETWTNVFTNNRNAVYSIIPVSDKNCSGLAEDVTVIVKPKPDLSSLSSTVCSKASSGITLAIDNGGVDITGVTYTVTSINAGGLTDHDGTDITGNSGGANLIANEQWLNLGTDDVDVIYTISPLGDNGCTGESETVTVTVKPQADLTTQTTTVCSKDATGITLTIDNGGGDVGSVTYTVNSINHGGLLTDYDGTDITGNSGGANLITNEEWQNTTANNVNVLYTITPQGSNGCPGEQEIITVTVRPEADLSAASNTVCSKDLSGLTLGIDNGGGDVGAVTYEITSISAPGLTDYDGTDRTGFTGGTNLLANEQWKNTTASNVDVDYTITPTGTNGCQGESEIVTLTVEPEADLSAISNTVCSKDLSGITLSIDNAGAAVGAVTYLITNINDGGLVDEDGTDIDGTSGGSNLLAGEQWRNTGANDVDVVYTIVPTGTNGCTGEAETVTLTVKPQADLSAASATICSRDNVGITLAIDNGGGDVGAVQYTVTLINDGGLIDDDGTDISGNTGGANIISNERWKNININNVNVIYTITPEGANGCTGEPETVTVTVRPEPNLSAITNTVCSKDLSGLTLSVDNGGGAVDPVTYTVTSINDNGLSDYDGTDITGNSGGTNLLAGERWQNTTANNVNVVYTITPTGNNGCAGEPETVTLTVRPEADLSDISNTVCSKDLSGITLSIDNAGATVGAVTYLITNINDGGLFDEDGTDIDGTSGGSNLLAGEQWRNTGANDIDVVYTIRPTGTNGCAGEEETVTLTVKPQPDLSALSGTVCSKSDVGITLAIDNGGGDIGAVTYFINSINHGGLLVDHDGTDITGTSGPSGYIFGEQWQNLTANDVDVVYNITPTGANGCTGEPENITITIEPEPDLAAASNTVCSKDGTGITLSIDNGGGDVGAVTYTVTSINANGLTDHDGSDLTGTSGPSNHISGDQWKNTTANDVNVIYTITPQGGNGCTGEPETVTVTVEPEADLSTITNTVCSKDVSGLTLSIDNGGGDVGAVQYTVDLVNDGGLTDLDGTDVTGTAGGSNILAAERWKNTTNSSVNVIYTITPEGANGCTGEAETVTLTVKPEPVVSVQTTTICSDVPLDYQILLDNFTNPGDNVTFTWPAPSLDPNVSGGTARGTPSAANITDVFTNVSGSTGDATYTITPYYDGCQGDDYNFVVTVGSEPVLADLDQDACSNVPTGLILDVDAGSVPAAEYNVLTRTVDPALAVIYQKTVPSSAVSDTFLQSETYRNLTGVPRTVVYSVEPVFGPGCVGNAKDITITVQPEPILALGQTKTVCSGVAIDMEVLLNPANTPAGSNFSWNLPVMSDASVQGTTASHIAADPPGTIHITDALDNYTGAPITATYYVIPQSANGCYGDSIPVVITIDPFPNTGTMDGDTALCGGATNKVYNVNATGGSQYTWDVPASLGTVAFGGGINDAFVIINASAGPATDTISVIEQNSYGCLGDTVKKGVEVFPSPPPSVITGDNPVCAGDTSKVYSVPDNAGSVYTWTLPPGSSIVSDPNLHEITVNFGTMSGNISVTETTVAGCVTGHTPLAVTVNPLPNAAITPDQSSICTGETVTFTATPASQPNYKFYVDGVLAQDGASDTYATDSLVNGEGVTVEVTNASGCSKVSSGSYVLVHDLPVVTLSSSDADDRICEETLVTFTAVSGTASGFNFLVNGVSAQNSPSTTFDIDTLHDGDIVSVIGTTVFGCSDTSNAITTTVDPLPVALFAGDATICETTSTDLTVTLSAGTGSFILDIDNGVGSISNYDSDDPISVSPAATTTYNLLSVQDANGCLVTAPHANITGAPTVTVNRDIVVTIEPTPVTDCPGEDVLFQVAVTGTSPVYQWRKDGSDLSDGGNISGATTDQLNIDDISAADAGNYDVKITGACQPDSSNVVALTVLEDISITSDPVDVTECPGDTITFGVAATGTSPTYRWRKNGTPLLDGGSLSGSLTDTLTISGITTLDAGTYDVIVSGTCEPDTSATATLALNTPPQISTQPVAATVCEDGATSFSVDAGATTSPTYQWEVDDHLGGGFAAITPGAPYSGENSASLAINPAVSAMNGFTYRVLVGGTCSPGIYSSEVDLTVNEKPEITVQPTDSTVCEDASVTFSVNPGATTTPVYYWEVNDGGGFDTITGAPYIGYNTSQLGILNTVSSQNGYQFRVNISGACAPDVISNIATLTVNEKPEIGTDPVDATECEDGLVTFTVDPGATTAPAYQWQVDAGAGFQDISGGVYSGETTATLTADPISSGMNGYRYRAKITGTCAPEAISSPASLTVDEKPEILADPSDVTVCEDDNTIFVVNEGVTTDPAFAWEYNTGSGWNPVPADAMHSGITNDTLYITAAPSTSDGWLYRVTVSGKCAPSVTSAQAELTVNDRPEILSQPVDSTICEDANAAFTVDAGATTGVTYQWQVSTGGSFSNIFGGLYSGENSATLSITGAVSTMNGYRYRVLVGGDCTPSLVSDTAVLTVLDKPEVLINPVDATICEDGNTLFGIDAGVTTSPVYRWQVNDGGGYVDVVASAIYSGEDTDTLNITGAPSSMTGYEYQVIVSGTCAPDATSGEATLIVWEKPEIIAQPQDSTICESGGASFGVDAGMTTNPSYQWQVDQGSGFGNVSGALYSGQNSATLNIFNAPSTMNGYLYRVIVSGNCAPADTSASALFTVNDRPEILTQPSNATVCEDGSTLFGIDAGVTDGATFVWEVNDGGGFAAIAPGAPYSGEDTDTLDINPAVSAMNGYTYRVVVSGICTPPVTSNTVYLTVNEKPEILTQPSDTTVCEGLTAVFSVDAGVTTSPAYQWQVNDGGGWADATGGVYVNDNTPNLGITSTSTPMHGYQYRVIVSGACAPADTSVTATLYINETPEISVHPSDTTQCEDGNVIFGVDAGVTTAPAYQWQVDQGFGFINATGGVYSGENTDTLTITGITSAMHGYKYRVVVSGTCAPPVNSNQAFLYVNEKPEVVVDPSNVTMCEDDNAIFVVNPGVTTGPTFQWEYDTGSGYGPVPADAIHSGVDNDTLFLTAVPSASDTWQYRAVVSGTCAPDATSTAALLTVYDRPEITLQPEDSTICEDGDAAFTVDAGLTTGATYQWQVSTGGAFLNVFGGVYSGENTATLQITGAPNFMDGYMYRVMIGGACPPDITSDTATLTVLEKPEIVSQPMDDIICEDDSTFFGINAGVTTGAVYRWQVDDGGGYADVAASAIYAGEDTDTLLVRGALSTMTGYTYRVIVSGTCAPADTSADAELTVYEKPEITSQPSDSTICENGDAGFSVVAGSTTSPGYQWQVNDGGGWANAFGPVYTGTFSADLQITNAPSSMNGYLYRVIISGACAPADTSVEVTLTVNEKPEIVVQPTDPVVCEDGSTIIGIDAGVTTNPAFEWQVNDGGGYVTANFGPYTDWDTDTLVIDPATSGMDGYTYQVIVSGTCTPQATSDEVTLTVDEKPEVLEQPSDSTVCEGSTAGFSVDAGVTTQPGYQWQVNDGGGWSDISGGDYFGYITSNLLLTTTSSAMDGYQYRAVISGKCAPADTSNAATLTILENPEILSQPEDTTECEDGTVKFGVDPGITTGPTFQWQVDEGSGFGDITGGIYSDYDTDSLIVAGITSAMHGYRYRVIVGGTCAPEVTSDPAQLFINEKPEISSDPADEAVCEFDGATFTVAAGVTTDPEYKWEYDQGIGSWIDVPTDATYPNPDSSVLVITTTDISMDGFKYRAVVSGKCAPGVTSGEATLTVYQRPEITLQPVDEIICEDGNTAFTVDAGLTTNPTYQWQVSTGGGFNNVGGAVYSGETTATLTLTGAPSGMDGYLFRVIVSGQCNPSVTSDTATLTVLQKPEVLAHPDDAAECEDGSVIFRVDPGLTTAPAYQWQENSGSGWGDLSESATYVGVTNDTLTVNNLTAGMHNNEYRVVISGTCTPDATSNSAVLTIYDKPEIVTQPVDRTICEDGNTTFTVDAGVTTSPAYQWQVDMGSGFNNVSGGFYSGQNSATLNVTGAVSAMNGFKYRVIVSGYCAPSDTSAEVTLTINEKPEVTGHPANAMVCEDGNTGFKVDAGVTTNPVYEWQVNDGGGFVTADFGPYSNWDTDSLEIAGVTSAMNGYLYRVKITGDCTPEAFSNNAVLFVQEKPEVLADPQDSVICENGNAAFTVDAGVTASPSYQWQENDGGGWTDVSDGGKYVGSQTSNLSIFNGEDFMDGYRYRVVVSGACTPDATSADALLTVNTRPAIVSSPTDAVICENGDTSFTVSATGSDLTYQWEVDQGSGYSPVSDGGVYSGATTPTLTLTSPDRTYDGYKYRVLVSGYCTPAASSGIARLTINTAPEISDQPDDVALCEFNNTNFQVSAAGGGLSYQWQENDGGGWSDISDAGNYIGTATPNLNIFTVDSAMTGYRYRVVISGQCTPDATSAEATMTVNTAPLITAHPQDTITCETVSAGFSVSAVGTGLTYKWQENNGGGFTDLVEGGTYTGTDAATLSINAPPVSMNGNTYRVIVSGTCVPPTTSNIGQLTVNTFPAIMTHPDSYEICEDDNVTFIAAASGTGITYHWQENSGSGFTDISDGGIYSGANTTTLTLTGIPTTNDGYRYRLQVRGTCAAINSSAADLTVNPNPSANITGDGDFPLVCGGLPLALNGNPSGGSGTYSSHLWTGDVLPLDAVNIQSPTFSTVADGSYNLTYTVTDSKGCIAKDLVTITNDRPDANFVSNAKPACGTVTVDFTNQSTGAVSYQWDFDDPMDPGTVTDTDPSHGFANFTSQVYYFNVELVAFSSNGCTDTSRQVVTVYPSIDASFTSDQYEGCNPVVATLDAIPGGSNYFWDYGDGNAENAGAQIVHQFNNTGTDSVTYTVSLTTTSFYGCVDTKTQEITVYPLPTVNFTADPIIQQYPDATVNFNNLTATGSWSFEWNLGDGNTSNEFSPSHTYAEPGMYTVTLTAETALCADSAVHQITIEPASPVAAFSEPAAGCAPLEIQFENNSQYGTSYVWDFGNGSTSFKENPTFTYYESGIYSVTLTVFGPGGTDNFTQLIEVSQTPAAYATVAPQFVFVNDVPVKCFNLTTDTSGVTYLWEFGDNQTSTEVEPIHVYQEPGRFDITLTATNANQCSSSYTFSYVEVEPAGELVFPNVFRPNPDGPGGGEYVPGQDNNQVFFPGVYDQVIEYELTVYNRWGEQIFISRDVNIGWDGYLDNGNMAEQGVYVWKVKGKYANGKNFVHVGDITLLK